MRTLPILLLLLLPACVDDDAATGPEAPDAAGACARGELEPDLMLVPLAGPAVDPATGRLMPPPAAGYHVSSTYLKLRGEATAMRRFGELMAPIEQVLQDQPGLLALQLGTSSGCGIARTLAVWQDEAAMLRFVTSVAHSDAIASVGEVSRGGSVATSWTATSLEQTTWEFVTATLAAHDGPYY